MIDDEQLKHRLRQFAQERAWDPFHTPRNLAASISIEAAELLELFQWSQGQHWAELDHPKTRSRVEEELADLFLYLLRFADLAKVDITAACLKKLELNATKYPIEKAWGSDKKYDAD